MIVARENLPGAPVYFSSQTHYSIAKSAGFYRMEVSDFCCFLFIFLTSWKACPVETRQTGEIDIEDFRKKLQANKDRVRSFQTQSFLFF